MGATCRLAARGRGDHRRIVRLSRIGATLAGRQGEEDDEAISTARRAAELIQYYWPDLYRDQIQELAVTPATMYATVGLFLGLATRDLIMLQDWGDLYFDVGEPVELFQQRCQKPAPKEVLLAIYESRFHVWSPAPIFFGLDLQWLAEEEPNDRFTLIALIWRLWCKNPIMMNYFGHISQDAAERLVHSEKLIALINAVEPLPMLEGQEEARKAFWELLEIDLGTHPLHEVTLGEVVGHAIGQTYNEFAAYSCNDIDENFGGDYGIAWADRDHVAQVHTLQQEAEAIHDGFWEMSELLAECPTLIPLLAEALHTVVADVRAAHPGPDMDAIRAEVRAVVQAGRALDAMQNALRGEENHANQLPGAEEAQAEGADHAPAHARAA